MILPHIVFEDDQLLVLDKPAGLVVNDAESAQEQTLERWLTNEKKIMAPRGGIVHRLDKDTSGILLVGKSDETVEKLQEQFANRSIKKEYVALVHGLLEGKAGTISTTLGRNPKNRTKFAA